MQDRVVLTTANTSSVRSGIRAAAIASAPRRVVQDLVNQLAQPHLVGAHVADLVNQRTLAMIGHFAVEMGHALTSASFVNPGIIEADALHSSIADGTIALRMLCRLKSVISKLSLLSVYTAPPLSGKKTC